MSRLAEEDNLYANFGGSWKFTTGNRAEVGRNSFTDEEFEKILIYLEGGTLL